MMFSKMDAKNKQKKAASAASSATNALDEDLDPMVVDDDDMPDIDEVLSKGGGSKSKKLSVERIYQKKSQLEHILLRPDTYIGSTEHITQACPFYF